MERDRFLARVRRGEAVPPLPPTLPATMVTGDGGGFDRFARELAAVGGEARLVDRDDLDGAVAAAVAGCATAVVGPDLGDHAEAAMEGLGRAGCRPVEPGRSNAAAADTGITGAVLGVVSTGSVLVSSAAGARSTSLLPRLHLVVLPLHRLVPGFEELFEAMPALVADASQLVLVTGPSRTGDIEMTLVHGVHGPERVVVLGVS